jgi:hypothetical protein
MEAAVNSIRSELEETINNRLADVLSFVNQRTQILREEIADAKISGSKEHRSR